MAGRQFDGGTHFRKPPLEHTGTNHAMERETTPTDNSAAIPKGIGAMRNMEREAQLAPPGASATPAPPVVPNK